MSNDFRKISKEENRDKKVPTLILRFSKHLPIGPRQSPRETVRKQKNEWKIESVSAVFNVTFRM